MAVIGGLNIDLFIRAAHRPASDGSVWTDHPVVTAPGGHAGNIATSARRCGTSVRLVAAVGDDSSGELLLSDLSEDGVEVGDVERVIGVPTGQVFVMTLGPERFMVMDRGANDHLTPSAADVLAPDRFAGMVVVADPPVSVAVGLLRQRRDAPCVVMPGGELIGHSAVLEAVSSSHWIVINEDEWRVGDGPLRAAVERAAGAVVTEGPKGATVLRHGRATHVPAVPVEEVDATGAGDAFTGGFAAGLLRGASPEVAAQLGAALGAACVQYPGARVPVQAVGS